MMPIEVPVIRIIARNAITTSFFVGIVNPQFI